MTAEQAARAFFEACGREDWDEAGKFTSLINERVKQAYGGLEIVSLGESFTSKSLQRPVCALRNQTATAGIQCAGVQRQLGETVRVDGIL